MIHIVVTVLVIAALVLLALPTWLRDRRARRNRRRHTEHRPADRDEHRARTRAAVAQLTTSDLDRVLAGISRTSTADHHTTKGATP